MSLDLVALSFARPHLRRTCRRYSILHTMMQPSASFSITVRLLMKNRSSALGRVLVAAEHAGGVCGAIDIVRVSPDETVRDLTVSARDETHADEMVRSIDELPDVEVLSVSDRTFLMHLGGKIEIAPTVPLKTRDDLSMAYTPGVARVCLAIERKPEDSFNLTLRANTVAVVSDGSAVLGLGDIGPEAALPVMEGKAALFKVFGGVNAFPICLDMHDADAIVAAIAAIAPTFGGINLEDIAAPRCFEIERRLRERLEIPVFHDDQHGTAVVVMAALINALKVVHKPIQDLKIVVNGMGAAGIACARMLMAGGAGELVGFDSKGLVHPGRRDLTREKAWFAEVSNPKQGPGGLEEVLRGADVFLGLSSGGVLDPELLDVMADQAVVFAMANPVPEVMPELARGRVTVMATGRSDYPNQINNVLCFPGIFRGALECRARDINEEMKMAAAEAIASVIPEEELGPDYIIPSVFDARVAPAIADAVVRAAVASGVARRSPESHSAPRQVTTVA